MSLNNSIVTQSMGVPYQQYVTSSAGHTLVSSSTYFNDTSDNLPRYKDANGLIYDPFITSSYSITASHALNAGGGGSTFPFTGDAEITGSLIVSGSSNKLDISLGENVFVGKESGRDQTDNRFSVFLGSRAGLTNSTGNQNIGIGYGAGGGIGTAGTDGNVFIGSLAGAGNSSIASIAARMSNADNNVGIGYQALLYLTSGQSNVAIGTLAMRGSGAAMSSTQNIALGYASLYKTDSGDNNIGIGYYAGFNQTTGDGNITIGSGSLGVAGESNQLRIGNGNDLVTISASLATGDIIFANTASAAVFSGSTYYGDGSNLSGIETDPFPYTGDVQITGSLTISGSDAIDLTVEGGLKIISSSTNTLIGLTIENQGTPTSAEGYGAGIKLISGPGTAPTITGSIFVKDDSGGGANPYHPALVLNTEGGGIYLKSEGTLQNSEMIRLAGGSSQRTSFNMYQVNGNMSHYNMVVNNGGNTSTRILMGQPSSGYYMEAGAAGSTYSYTIGTHGGNTGTFTPYTIINTNGYQILSNVTASGNISSSATSTASFGTYLGDGSQLSGISTTPFPFSGSAIITGSLTVSGSVVDFMSASAVLLDIESLPLVNPKVEYITTSAITSSGTTVPLPNALTFVSSSTYEYLEVFINGLRMRYDMDFIPASTASVQYQITIPSGSEVTYKSLKRP